MSEVRACAGKERFASHAIAARVAKRQAKKYGLAFSAYYCRTCGGFHSGSRIGKKPSRPRGAGA